MDNSNLDIANKPRIYSGTEGVAQWQIAARILHGIPNKAYAIEMTQNTSCLHCDRYFSKLFHFIDKQDASCCIAICPACIDFLGVDGLIDFLHKNKD